MKAKTAILVFLSLLLFSCVPTTPTQEDEIVTEEIVTEESISQPVTTEEPIFTEEPTEVPTIPPIACLTLLTPVNRVEIPPVGKVTFSWTAMNEAGKYVLNIILPSGEIVSFETDQTFYDRYMEAFVAGGEYQWQVIAQSNEGSEICVSEISTFDKPAYNNPNGGVNDGSSGGSGSGGEEPPPPPGGGGND